MVGFPHFAAASSCRLGCPGMLGCQYGVVRTGRSSPVHIGATLVTLGCALEELRPILQSGGLKGEGKSAHVLSSLNTEGSV